MKENTTSFIQIGLGMSLIKHEYLMKPQNHVIQTFELQLKVCSPLKNMITFSKYMYMYLKWQLLCEVKKRRITYGCRLSLCLLIHALLLGCCLYCMKHFYCHKG